MSHSRQTEHYGLPLYNGTDIINPLTDFNDANDAIDTALYNANQTASSANTKADEAIEAVAGYDTRITQAETKADNALTKNSDTEKMIANQFDPLKEGGYAIGDSVIYNDKLFTFINPHTGAWDASDVVNQPITDAVKSTIAEGKAEIEQETQEAMAEIATQTQKVTATQKMIAEPFDPEKDGGYSADAVVTYADKLYQFNSAHAGAWTGADVTEIDITTLVDAIDTRVDTIENTLDGVLHTTKIAEFDAPAGTWGGIWASIKQHLNTLHPSSAFIIKADLNDAAMYDGYLYADGAIAFTNTRFDGTNLNNHAIRITASDVSTLRMVQINASTGAITTTDESATADSGRHVKLYLVN